MKQKMSIEVRGKRKEWSFEFEGDDKYLQEWWDDGLNVMIITETIPEWVSDFGLAGVWYWIRGLFIK